MAGFDSKDAMAVQAASQLVPGDAGSQVRILRVCIKGVHHSKIFVVLVVLVVVLVVVGKKKKKGRPDQ